MRWPWQRAVHTSAVAPAVAATPPAGWAFLPPIDRTMANALPSVLAPDFLPSLSLRTDPSFLGDTVPQKAVAAPGGTIDLDAVAGRPRVAETVADLGLRRPRAASAPVKGAVAQRQVAQSEADLEAVVDVEPGADSQAAADAVDRAEEPSSPVPPVMATQRPPVPAVARVEEERLRRADAAARPPGPVVARRPESDRDVDVLVDVDVAQRLHPTARDDEPSGTTGDIPPDDDRGHDATAVAEADPSHAPDVRVVARLPLPAEISPATRPPVAHDRASSPPMTPVPDSTPPGWPSTARSAAVARPDGDAPMPPLIQRRPIADRRADASTRAEPFVSGSSMPNEEPPVQARAQVRTDTSPPDSARSPEPYDAAVPSRARGGKEPPPSAARPPALQRTSETERTLLPGTSAVAQPSPVLPPPSLRSAVQASTRASGGTADERTTPGAGIPVSTPPLRSEPPFAAQRTVAPPIQRAAVVGIGATASPQPPSDGSPASASVSVGGGRATPTLPVTLVQRLASGPAPADARAARGASEAFAAGGWLPSVQRLPEEVPELTSPTASAGAPTADAGPAPSVTPGAVTPGAVSGPGAPPAVPTRPEEIDALVAALYPAMVRRLRNELLTDRERRGVRIDGV